MEKLATRLTRYVIRNSNIAPEAFEIYKYGFQIGLEMSTCVIVSLLISVYLHMFPEFIVFIVAFVSLRTYMGGLHLNNFFSCFICSTAVQTGVLIWASEIQFPMYWSWIIILVCMGIILYIAPVDNVNRILEKDEKVYVYKKVVTILLCILSVGILFTFIKSRSFVSLIADTLFVIVVSAVLGKIKNYYEMMPQEKNRFKFFVCRKTANQNNR